MTHGKQVHERHGPQIQRRQRSSCLGNSCAAFFGRNIRERLTRWTLERVSAISPIALHLEPRANAKFSCNVRRCVCRRANRCKTPPPPRAPPNRESNATHSRTPLLIYNTNTRYTLKQQQQQKQQQHRKNKKKTSTKKAKRIAKKH